MSDTVELFTVRVWREALTDHQTEWRGKVQHLGSGEVRYFRDWTKLVGFIKDTLSNLTGNHNSLRQIVAKPLPRGRLQARNTQSRHSYTNRLSSQKEPSRHNRENVAVVRESGQPGRKNGKVFLKSIGKIRLPASHFNLTKNRLSKNVGFITLAVILFILGLVKVGNLDPTTTGAIIGSKPLLMGMAGVFKSLHSKKREHAPVSKGGSF
jgi:hypothetical protein